MMEAAMYCRNCAFPIEPQQSACKRCLTPAGLGNSFCKSCAARTPKDAAFCPKCGEKLLCDRSPSPFVSFAPDPSAVLGGKSRIAAALLGIFPTGMLGIHNFYLGYTGRAVAQLLLTVLSFGILMPAVYVWSILEGVFILSGDETRDADGTPLRD